jgi:hypothetical protein
MPPMHPLMRNVVIGVVALIIAGALTALALLGTDSNLSVLALLAAGTIGTVIGAFLYAQGWIWGSRAARQRSQGQATLIAVGAGADGAGGGRRAGRTSDPAPAVRDQLGRRRCYDGGPSTGVAPIV